MKTNIKQHFKPKVGMNILANRKSMIIGLVTLFIWIGAPVIYANTSETNALSESNQANVTGEIKDSHGEAIIGASVLIKGTKTGTITDLDGKFTIAAKTGDVLVISYIGYQTQEVTIGTSHNLSITLVEEHNVMDEVVVVGYGTQKKVNLTGSVSSIKAESLERRPILSTSSALQGIAAGVTVTTQSGAPGADGGTIRIRGINSFGGSNSAPLVLIDGMEGVLDYLDPNQIESISVLKDAASAAIYGSRAANGVILVTTKRTAEAKKSFTYKGYVGWQQETDLPKVTDGITYMDVFNEAAKRDGSDPVYQEADYERYRKGYAANPKNYDWQDAVMQGSGFMQNHFVSMTMQSGDIVFMPSFSYSEKEGLIKNTDYKRYVFRNNMDVQILKNLKMKMDVSFANGDRKQIGNEGTIWNYIGRIPTTEPIKNEDGSWAPGWIGNNLPALISEGGNKKTNNIELLGNLNLTYDPFEWLSLTGQVSPRYRTRNTHTFIKRVDTYEGGMAVGDAIAVNPFTKLSEREDRYFFETYQFYANFNKKWGDHSFNLMLGTSREATDEKWFSGYREQYIYNDYEVLNAGSGVNKDSDGLHYKLLLVSFFGRLNYNFKDRYLLEANFRRDGSSRFAKGNGWSTFPSFSGAWRISEEDFMKNTRSYLDQLKLRASWGQLGEQDIRGFHPYIENLAMGDISYDDIINQLVTLNTMANPDLKWETTTVLNFGLDASLFNSRLNITAEWYRKITDDILLKLPISDLIGLNAPYQNAGKVRNLGWEFSANYNDKWGDFDFGIGFNISDVKNEILDMRGLPSSTGLISNQEGYAINSIYGYLADGYYQSQEEIDNGPTQWGKLQPGDVRYKDLAGAFDENGDPIPDGKISDADKVIIGSTIPRYTYGINLDFGWKGFKLNAFFQGVGKVDGYLNSHYVIPGVNASAVKTWQLDYWTEDNRNAEFPRLSTISTNNTQNSTHWMRSASYLRLKNLQFGYTIPKKLTEKFGVKNLYIYANAQNLFTVTDFWKGYDPEIAYDSSATDGVSLGGGNYYPQVKVFSIGVDIKF